MHAAVGVSEEEGGEELFTSMVPSVARAHLGWQARMTLLSARTGKWKSRQRLVQYPAVNNGGRGTWEEKLDIPRTTNRPSPSSWEE